jgi:hypothetical protein
MPRPQLWLVEGRDYRSPNMMPAENGKPATLTFTFRDENGTMLHRAAKHAAR